MKFGKPAASLHITCILALAVTLLAGCGGSQPTPTPQPAAFDEAYVSAYLPTSYEDALNASGQLALGILQLEETANAVSADQAGTLLPLWQALRGGALQGQEEMSAVLKQIEGALNDEQLQAIAAMQLTREDLGTWAESRGLRFDPEQLSPEARETRQAQFGGQGPDPEAMATRQAQFGGQGPDPEAIATLRAQMENMTDEEREALRATAQAGGAAFGGRGGMGGFFGGVGQARVVLGPLIELLTERAGE